MTTKKTVLRVLKQHNCSPTENSEYNPETKQPISKTSFFDQIGNKKEYNLKEVLVWLGY